MINKGQALKLLIGLDLFSVADVIGHNFSVHIEKRGAAMTPQKIRCGLGEILFSVSRKAVIMGTDNNILLLYLYCFLDAL
ncbi:hypothetical protein CX649_10215 [Bacillaceae bacterium ZC4]|nr:hypothetical protein CX649_10215 [Bacillaceae bacterium ZC4]